jgi:hypothetical protein
MNPASIPALQDEYTARWHSDLEAGSESGLNALILEQHRQNFALWHEEDRARGPLTPAEQIAQTKRNIDALNQVRNDLVEAIDKELLLQLERHRVRLSGELHSETPGMMIDRLSILSLKIFHTREQLERGDVDSDHIHRNRERLQLLIEQRDDLAQCLAILWQEVQSGKRRFKLYRQLKMYNDPTLNPEIYGSEPTQEPD